MIPEAAVEAAKSAYLNEFNYDENAEYIARIILEAAAPHMLGAAWDDGATDGHLYGIKAINPYRTTR